MVVAGGVVVACGQDPRSPPPPAKDSGAARSTARPTVLLVGTSLTAGLGLDPRDAGASHLQEKVDSSGLRFTIVNAGVSGETSADALHRVDWLLSRGVPAVVLLETGANDALRGQPVAAIRANIDAILSRLDQVQPRPVLLVAGMEALPNLGRAYGGQFRDLFVSVARAHHAVYLPFLLSGVAGVDSLNQGDGIHPNAAGSRRVADNVWRTLRPILDSFQKGTHASL
jgi:acyl-CoA thioesterase-1